MNKKRSLKKNYRKKRTLKKNYRKKKTLKKNYRKNRKKKKSRKMKGGAQPPGSISPTRSATGNAWWEMISPLKKALEDAEYKSFIEKNLKKDYPHFDFAIKNEEFANYGNIYFPELILYSDKELNDKEIKDVNNYLRKKKKEMQ